MARGMRESNVTYATRGSAAADLVAAEATVVPAGERVLVHTTLTGEELELEASTAALVMPRSGLAHSNGITVLNSPGLIDPDYRGIIGVILYNTSGEEFVINAGDRIAQLMVVPFKRIYGAKVSNRERGAGGYGSTGR